MQRRITQRDIALHLGIGRSTVSMALREDRRITPELRKKVRLTANELGYKPDPALSALAAYRKTIQEPKDQDSGNRFVLLYPHFFEKRDADERFPLVKGLSDRCHELGYNLELLQTGFDFKSLRGSLRECTARGVKGIFVIHASDEIWEYPLDWSQIPVIALGGLSREAQVPQVMPDTFRGTYDTLHRLHAMGFSRPGLAMPRKPWGRDHLGNLYGFMTGYQDSYGTGSPPILHRNSENAAPGFDAITHWVNKHDIDVLLDTQRSLIGNWKQLRVKTKAQFVALDIPEEAPEDLTGLLYNRYTIGREGANLLSTRARFSQRDQDAQNPVIQIPMKWQDGESCVPPG